MPNIIDNAVSVRANIAFGDWPPGVANVTRWLNKNGYYRWGSAFADAWLHNSDDGHVMTTQDAIADCLRRVRADG